MYTANSSTRTATIISFILLILFLTSTNLASTTRQQAVSLDTHAAKNLTKRYIPVEDPVKDIVDSVLVATTVDEPPESDLDQELDWQDETPVPQTWFDPPPPPAPKPITLARECADPFYRLTHGNSTCRDWVKECVLGDYTIRTRPECNGYSTDPAAGATYVDSNCINRPDGWSSRSPKGGSAHCRPWATLLWQHKCRDKEWLGWPLDLSHRKPCVRVTATEADLVHNSRSPFWRDPLCSTLEHRLHFWGWKGSCKGWHWNEAAKECRIYGEHGDGPRYKGSDFCIGACLRDPDCPARKAARERAPALCERKGWFKKKFRNVCKGLSMGGDIYVWDQLFRL